MPKAIQLSFTDNQHETPFAKKHNISKGAVPARRELKGVAQGQAGNPLLERNEGYATCIWSVECNVLFFYEMYSDIYFLI